VQLGDPRKGWVQLGDPRKIQVTPQNVTLHLKAIYAEGELQEAATCKESLQVRTESGRRIYRAPKHHSLPDGFLKISGREILDRAGRVSAEMAKAKAALEYDQYHALLDSQPRKVDADFEAAVKNSPKQRVRVSPKRDASHERSRNQS
jgi:hypothetical protein